MKIKLVSLSYLRACKKGVNCNKHVCRQENGDKKARMRGGGDNLERVRDNGNSGSQGRPAAIIGSWRSGLKVIVLSPYSHH